MVREIALDTETTGLSPADGHRIIEIGCVEMVNQVKTGRTLQVYLNPERDVPMEAQRVHGISTEFLRDKPKFHEVAQQFLEFISDSKLIIHNAAFDMQFINSELVKVGQQALPMSRALDTLLLARSKFPGQSNNLDALCKRFNIDKSHRKFHGALLDSELLADIYLHLCGGRQSSIDLSQNTVKSAVEIKRTYRNPRPHKATLEEVELHQQFISKIKNALWITLRDKDQAA